MSLISAGSISLDSAFNKRKFLHFFIFLGHFCPTRSESVFPMRIRIKIQPTKIIIGSGPTTLPVGVNFNLVNIIACSIFRLDKKLRQIHAHSDPKTFDIPVPEQNQMKYVSQLEAHQKFFFKTWTWQDVFDRLTKGANEQELREIGGYTF